MRLEPTACNARHFTTTSKALHYSHQKRDSLANDDDGECNADDSKIYKLSFAFSHN